MQFSLKGVDHTLQIPLWCLTRHRANTLMTHFPDTNERVYDAHATPKGDHRVCSLALRVSLTPFEFPSDTLPEHRKTLLQCQGRCLWNTLGESTTPEEFLWCIKRYYTLNGVKREFQGMQFSLNTLKGVFIFFSADVKPLLVASGSSNTVHAASCYL